MDSLAGIADITHALIGCNWGTLIASTDDDTVCWSPAVQMVVLHAPDGAERMVKLCEEHWHVVMEETTPHREDA